MMIIVKCCLINFLVRLECLIIFIRYDIMYSRYSKVGIYMKKGFTLIELLAVIVILAVIALIVTPVVTNIISSTKDSADKRSAEAYVKAGENYFSQASLNNNPLDTNVVDKLEVSKKADGEVIVNSDGTVEMAIIINNKCYTKKATDSIANIEVKADTDDCSIKKYVTPEASCFKTQDIDDNNIAITEYTCVNSFLSANATIENNIIVAVSDIVYGTDGTQTEVDIPSYINGKKVTTIAPLAFSPFSATGESTVGKKVGITKLNIPNTVTTIGQMAFGGNTIKELYIPSNVTEINDYVFGYNEITKLILPNQITKIGAYAFWGNDINSLILPDTLTTIGSHSFEKNSHLSSVELPNKLETIGESAFALCNLSSIEIPSTVITIGSHSFEKNSNLSSVELPNKLETIGESAFALCNLSSIEIPSTVTSIGSWAFTENKLEKIIINGKTSTSDFTTFGQEVFGWHKNGEWYTPEITWVN